MAHARAFHNRKECAGDRTEKRGFFLKKKQKHWRGWRGLAGEQMDKSFLVVFCNKQPLTFCKRNHPHQNQHKHSCCSAHRQWW
jgi:hypothetical protein